MNPGANPDPGFGCARLILRWQLWKTHTNLRTKPHVKSNDSILTFLFLRSPSFLSEKKGDPK